MTGKTYAGFDMGDINMITIKNILKFQKIVIVLDDMGDKFNENIVCFFTEGGNKKLQRIVMCHKPAQIETMARMISDTIFITTYNGADLFKIFNTKYECKHDFHGIIQEINNSYDNCTDRMADELRYGMIKCNKKEETFIIIDSNKSMTYDSRVGFLDLKALSLKHKLESDEIHKLIAYMKPLMISATDRAVVKPDNYQLYFNKLLTSRDIKIQNDVLTKEKINTNWAKHISGISGGLSALIMIYNCINPDTTVRTAAQVTAHASHIINRTDALMNYAWGEVGSPPSYQEYDEA